MLGGRALKLRRWCRMRRRATVRTMIHGWCPGRNVCGAAKLHNGSELRCKRRIVRSNQAFDWRRDGMEVEVLKKESREMKMRCVSSPSSAEGRDHAAVLASQTIRRETRSEQMDDAQYADASLPSGAAWSADGVVAGKKAEGMRLLGAFQDDSAGCCASARWLWLRFLCDAGAGRAGNSGGERIGIDA